MLVLESRAQGLRDAMNPNKWRLERVLYTQESSWRSFYFANTAAWVM
jgi:hypothetical protein